MLPVTFVKLSEKPKTVFLTKLAAPCIGCFVRHGHVRACGATYLRDADTEFPIAVHDNTIERLIEDIRHSGADVREQADRVTDEICRAQDTVELTEDLLSVVIYDTGLDVRHTQAHVFDGERVELQRRVVDVSDGHGYRVDDDG